MKTWNLDATKFAKGIYTVTVVSVDSTKTSRLVIH